MIQGKVAVSETLGDDVEDLFDASEYGDVEELRKAFWDHLYDLERVSSKQRHVLVRRLVDEAPYGEIGKELQTDAAGALRHFKRGLKNLRSYNGGT